MTDEAVALRDRALDEWAAGRHYEAHEILEDLAECFDEGEPAFAAALALTQIAACLHKLVHRVGASAVPGKLSRALGVLRASPPDVLGIDVPALIVELEALDVSKTAGSLPAPSVQTSGSSAPARAKEGPDRG